MKTAYILLAGMLSITMLSPALGTECTVKSGERRVALLELYTMVTVLFILLTFQAVTGLVLAGTDLYLPPLGMKSKNR